MSENHLYENILSTDGNYFYYSLKENNLEKKREAVIGIIEHQMETTYLFLKYPHTKGDKFVGIFEKDIENMKKSLDSEKPMVIYIKVGNRLK